METSEKKTGCSCSGSSSEAVVAELPDACCDKIRECEHELNRLGYWNIALVAYQMKGPAKG
ncbi:MAG: hypothetical protein Q4D55_10325 [Eubacteriales bacterium]|nr:hypothetical protein [Eubacteriales bacterium]